MSQNQIRTGITPIQEPEVPLSMFGNDEKISLREYRNELRPPIELLNLNNDQVEDCECENESEFMADMPTNESYTLSDNQEQKEDDNAIKFLTETGMLRKFDWNIHFDLNARSDSSNLGDIDSLSRASYKNCESSVDNFNFFEDPFGDEEEFNPAETLEKQLEKDPLPEPILLDISVSEKLSEAVIQSLPDIEIYEQSSPQKETNSYTKSVIWNETKPTIDEVDNEDVVHNSKTTKKKLTEFGYLLQRKGFRLMRKYYKEKFDTFAERFNYKKRVKVITPNEINHIIMDFLQTEFSTILPIINEDEVIELMNSLKLIILSDRSNKKEPMISGMDFSVVRNVFGKYTQKNMKLFMHDASNCFLYTHFYLINGRSACYEQTDVDQDNFNDQMRKLMFEAFKNLIPTVKPLYERLYNNYANKI